MVDRYYKTNLRMFKDRMYERYVEWAKDADHPQHQVIMSREEWGRNLWNRKVFLPERFNNTA